MKHEHVWRGWHFMDGEKIRKCKICREIERKDIIPISSMERLIEYLDERISSGTPPGGFTSNYERGYLYAMRSIRRMTIDLLRDDYMEQ